MKDVPTECRREGYVSGMVPKLRLRLAATKDVPIRYRVEDCVRSMVPQS